jgi:GT2 family glycosyltransferase
VREDVHSVLVVVCAAARPVGLRHFARPTDGTLATRDLLASYRARLETTVLSNKEERLTAAPLSVIVCTHERPDDLARCLEALAAITREGDETIVVDNCPRTDRTAAVAARFRVRRIVEPIKGLNRGRNAGLKASTHDIVAFIDDDVVVTPHWRPAITACFADPAVGCATGLVLPLELETPAQEEFELYSEHRRRFQGRVYSRDGVRPSAADVAGIGANMAFRRAFAVDLGGFDVRLDAGTCTRAGGDTDMFARVLDSGRLIAYSPDAQIWHRHRRTSRELTSCVFGYGVGTFGMLTKRVVEQGDFGALITAARWLAGTLLKAARLRIEGRPAPRWRVVLAETAGAACGPFCFAYEALRTVGAPPLS